MLSRSVHSHNKANVSYPVTALGEKTLSCVVVVVVVVFPLRSFFKTASFSVEVFARLYTTLGCCVGHILCKFSSSVSKNIGLRLTD